ncbi:MAG: SpoIIE family protein phosphatase [Lachnospiraceae bacterium]|nr:SpoIIE family protein phosphatase [Lachnospiraceae bacterium]
MKIIKGWFKIGGLQQKIFNLVLISILLLIGAYVAVTAWHSKNLANVVQEASGRQQDSIIMVSEQTMKSVVDSSMAKTTALQAYIADDLFADVKSDVLSLQSFATELFKHADSLPAARVAPPMNAQEGTACAQRVSEEGADPTESELLGIVANMSDFMISMYENSDKMSSCFIGTADGHMVLVNDRPRTFMSEDGTALTLDIRNRPWYTKAAAAGNIVFTGVEIDAYTDTPMVECAAPVYRDGELVAVVAADIYLSSISDYVDSTSSEQSFICVINEKGQLLFSPSSMEQLKTYRSANGPDLRESENKDFANFVTKAMTENTGVVLMKIGERDYYLCGVPMPNMGWAVLSVVDKEYTDLPTTMMLAQYDDINKEALELYEKGSAASLQTFIVLMVAIILMAILTALILAARIVKPVERMTQRLNMLGENEDIFEMEDVYRTGDEIEILAESFAKLSKRTRDYIVQITTITAEKERIGTELALATRIQADMLPNIYPAFPDRKEFDIYATMDPAKEVGGDFYDFFLVDEDHLCMVMADVSGKGVPAALFMMASKIILANNAMIGKSPAQILTDTNAAICSNNREEMFVTVWLGILELTTGKLTAANAGHEYPVLKKSDGTFELYKDKHGFVIGGMDGVRYKEYELTLEPGSKLFLYTDGVPEATAADDEQFGTERMVNALNLDPSAAPEQILKNVRKAVDEFVKEAEQFDDLTMLCLEYNGNV